MIALERRCPMADLIPALIMGGVALVLVVVLLLLLIGAWVAGQ